MRLFVNSNDFWYIVSLQWKKLCGKNDPIDLSLPRPNKYLEPRVLALSMKIADSINDKRIPNVVLGHLVKCVS